MSIEDFKISKNENSRNLFSEELKQKNPYSNVTVPGITNFADTQAGSFKNPIYSGSYGFDIEPFGSKLSDGSFSFKDQEIRSSDTPESLEERYSSKQSTFEKWQNGIAKAVTKAGIYATDALVGTAYGIVASVAEGNFNTLYDNDFSNAIDDLNTKLDNTLPNYYSEYEKQAGFLSSVGTANFWANDFLGGLSFLGGTVLSEGVLGLATGGASLATTLPRATLKAAIKKGAKQAGKKTLGYTAKKELINTLKDKVVRRGIIGEGLDLTGFAARSSIYEAGMEARLATKESIENYISNYKQTYGEEPSGEELTAFISDAKNASNGVFAANMAILIPSNLLMFGKLGTKSIKETSNSFINNKLFGLGYNKVKDKAGKLSLEAIKPNALQKITGNSYQLLKGPVTEGLWEEGMQGVATKTMMNYLGDKYNSKNNIENLSLTNSFYDAFAEQYGTSAGWKENLLGSMIGAVGGSFTSFTRGLKGGLGNALKNTEGIGGFGKQSYRSMVKENVDNVNAMNKVSENMLERANSLSAISENVKRQQVGDSKDISYTESQTYGINEDWSYINTMAPHKTKDEIKEDYAYSINNMEISSEVQKENGFSEEQIEQYKNDKIEKFNSRVDAALKAKQAVKYLNLDLGVTPGNKAAIEDAFAYNLYTGTNSLENAKDLSSQLDNIVGKEGTFSAINYFNNLTEDQKKASDRIKELKEEIEGLKAKSFKLAKLPKLSTFNSTTNKTETFAEKQRQTNLEIVKLTDLLNDKEAEKAELESKLDKKVTFNNIFGKSEDILGQGPIEGNITQMFEDLEAVDSYIKSLEEEGLTVEANSVSNLLKEIKFNLDSSREVAKQFDAMSRPGFFKKKGLSKLLETITGDKYSMSEDTIQLIRDNDEKVRKSLALSGLIPTKNTEDYIKEIIEGADNFSDKNKFHLEMMIRNIIKAEDLEFSLPEAPTSVAPLDVVKNGIKRSGAKLKDIKVDLANNPSLDYLNEVIDKIIESSNQLGDLISLNDPRVKEIQTKIDELKKEEQDPKRLKKIEELETKLEQYDSIEPNIAKAALEQSTKAETTTPTSNQSDIETKKAETEQKIQNKSLFSDGGIFANELGGSGVNSVPTNHREISGIEFIEFSNPITGVVDVVMTGTSDVDYVGYYRLYENGKPTNKWSSKFENKSRNKDNFKTMISGVQEMLPQGHEYTEKTSISTDGLRVWNQQLSRGYELQYDSKGDLITNTVAINGDAIVNELGIDVNQGNFDNISVTNKEQFELVKKALLPYLQKFGLNEKNIYWTNGTVEVDLPVLKNNKSELKALEKLTTTTEDIKAKKAEIERRRQEYLENNITLLNTAEQRRPNGSIGTQGFTEVSFINLARFISNKLNLNIPAYDKSSKISEIAQIINYLKNNETAKQGIFEYVKSDPIVADILPDDTYHFKDGNHRANLLNLIGVEQLPIISSEKNNEINAKYDAELAELKAETTTPTSNQSEAEIETFLESLKERTDNGFSFIPREVLRELTYSSANIGDKVFVSGKKGTIIKKANADTLVIEFDNGGTLSTIPAFSGGIFLIDDINKLKQQPTSNVGVEEGSGGVNSKTSLKKGDKYTDAKGAERIWGENTEADKTHEIEQMLKATAEGAATGSTIQSVNDFKAGKEIIFRKPQSIEAAKNNKSYNVEIQSDGSAKVIGVLDPRNNEWVGISKSNVSESKSTPNTTLETKKQALEKEIESLNSEVTTIIKEKETLPEYNSEDLENQEIDRLITKRLEMVGQPSDLFEDYTNALDNAIERIKNGTPTDPAVLKKTIDYIYAKVKEVLELKKLENKKDRILKNLTLTTLNDIYEDLSEVLEHLLEYENKQRTNESLPIFISKKTNEDKTATSERTSENIRRNSELTEQLISLEAELSALTAKKQELESEDANEKNKILIIKKEIESLKNQVSDEIETLEKSIISLKSNNKFKPEVKDYKRLETLLKKQDRTDEENSELENLKQFIDQWIKLDGTVADGVVLSDLIEQKIQLESQDVVEEAPIVNQTDSEIFESSNSIAINGTQGFTVSFNKLERGKLAITGISFKGLIEKINPLNKSQLPQEVDSGDVVIVELEKGNLEITVNEVGGLEIKKEQIELINSTTIKVINTSENQGTNFNVTLEENESGVKAVESDFGGDYVEGDPNEVAIYETQVGEEVTLKINLEDKHNQKLINSLPTKKSSKKINLEDEIENALEDDKTLKKLNKELSEKSNLLEKIEEKLEQKNTTDVKAKLLKEKFKTIKKIETLESSILKRENEVENTVRTGSTSKKISKEALAKLKKELVISVYTNRGENGNFTGTLKSQRGLDKDSVSIDTAKFNALRDQLVDKYLDTILEGSTETITLTETVSVQDVYLGHPNYNFERKGSKIVTRFDNIPQNRVKDIVDIGFIEKGSRFLRNKTKDVDTTFISKFKKNKGKTGIIVLNHFGRNIAYPVNTNERNVDFASKLKETFDGQKPSKELANNLNDILVEAGVDIKKEGFVFVSEKSRGNNLNDKEISNKVAQLEEKQYFYNLENWESSDNNMENTILNEMKINIDLNKPFHSPKFMLDFSKIEVKIPENTVIKKSKGSQGSSSIADKALGCKG